MAKKIGLIFPILKLGHAASLLRFLSAFKDLA